MPITEALKKTLQETRPEVELGVQLHGELFWNIQKDLDKVYRALNEYMNGIKNFTRLERKLEAHINYTIVISENSYGLYRHIKDGSIFRFIEDNDFLLELYSNLNRISPSTFYKLYSTDILLLRKYAGDFREGNKFWLSYAYSRNISSVLCRNDWILEAHLSIWSKSYLTLYNVMKEWRKNPPPKRVLKDFKKGLSEKKGPLYGRTILEDTLERLITDPGSLPREFLELLFYFTDGKKQVFIRKSAQHFILKNISMMKMMKEETEFFTEVIFGQKIVNRIEEEMDDSGPRIGILRARADLRKTLDVMHDEWGDDEDVISTVCKTGIISSRGDTPPD